MKYSDNDIASAHEALHALGLEEEEYESSSSLALQLLTFRDALRIFKERNARYNDVWKQSGWKGSLFDMRKKITRVWAQFWRGEHYSGFLTDEELDDAYDIINFAAFFIRNARDGNQFGQWG